MKTLNKNLLRVLAAAALALPAFGHAAIDGDDRDAPPRGPLHGPHGEGDGDGPRGPHGDAGPRGRHGPGPAFGLPGGPGMAPPLPFLRDVELTEAQQDKVFAILHGQAPYLRDQHKAREKAERALFALHGAAKYDDAQAVRLAQAAAQANANLTLQQLRTEQKVLALLTPEQRKQAGEGEARPPRAPLPPAAPADNAAGR